MVIATVNAIATNGAVPRRPRSRLHLSCALFDATTTEVSAPRDVHSKMMCAGMVNVPACSRETGRVALSRCTPTRHRGTPPGPRVSTEVTPFGGYRYSPTDDPNQDGPAGLSGTLTLVTATPVAGPSGPWPGPARPSSDVFKLVETISLTN